MSNCLPVWDESSVKEEAGSLGSGTSPGMTSADLSRGTGIPTSWINMQSSGGTQLSVVSTLNTDIERSSRSHQKQ